MAEPAFVHLRCRSDYSVLESALKVKEIARLCVADGQPAAALTDTNNLFGALEFSETLAAAGVQPIAGLTLAVRWRPSEPGAVRRAPDGGLAVLAQSEAGYRRLMALSSAAYLEVEGAEEPHLDLERVLEDTQGLIALTGGPDGVVEQALSPDDDAAARALVERLAAAFPDRLYLELQRHGAEAERWSEPFLLDCAGALGLPVVAANEPVFATPAMHEAHDVLSCIAQGSFLSVQNRRRTPATRYFASAAEMAERFADLPDALANTLDIARRCAFRAPPRKPILPRFTTEAGRDEAAELTAQAEHGLRERLAATPLSQPEEAYWARLRHELGVIIEMGFPGYFLIVADFIQWARREGVPVGPGRGSGAGSIVAWALTITDLDPLRFNLVFERFLNPERVSMPDFDIDFCQERREEVIAYVADRYGADRVAQIITFGTLQARAVLRDVGRVMQLPLGQVDRLAKLVPNNPAHPVTLAQAVESEERLQAERDREPEVAKLLDTALKLEGLYRNASTHAAGVVIGDRPLPELAPLYRDPRAPLPVTQFNMKWVELAGLVKFDFLGLKTLTVLARAVGFLEQAGVTLDLDAVPLDDEKTYQMLAAGETVGVFQFESTGMRDLLRRAEPTHIEDLIALVALYRPGPMENIPKYLACKHGEEKPEALHESLWPIVQDTYGVIIYQEQVMQIAQKLAGYSLGEADLLRRAMGKKKKEEMDKQRVRFVEGAERNGVERARADMIFDVLARFAGYGFNKAHSAAYAYVAYQTAYLKANYPVAFLAASMSLDIHNTDKLASFVHEARRLQTPIAPPDLNASNADFAVEGGAVRYALGAVRNVGLAAMEHVVAERDAGGPFADLHDVARRLDPRQVGKRTLENLARAGAFDSLGVERAHAMAAAETLLAIANTACMERDSAQTSLFGEAEPLAPPPLPDATPWTDEERLREELAAIGFYLSGHPLDEARADLERRRVVFAADVAACADQGRQTVRMAGLVARRQERIGAKSGERFAFVSLSDPTGAYEVLVPPEALARLRELLEPGARLLAHVRLADREGETRLMLDDAEPLVTATRGVGVRIHARDRAAVAAVAARLKALPRRDGAPCGPVRLVVTTGGTSPSVVELALGRAPVDAAARAALKTACGVDHVELLEEA